MTHLQRFATIFLLVSTGACAEVSDVTTGAWAEFRSELIFSGDSDVHQDFIKPMSVPDIAKVADSVVCGHMDPATSYVSLLEYQGAANVNFTLEATLVDGGFEIDYFSWASVLQANSKQIPLTEAVTNFNADAAERLAEILTRTDKSYQVRFSFTSDLPAEHVKAVFVQTLRVATESSSCP
jgi:hypothetical protein